MRYLLGVKTCFEVLQNPLARQWNGLNVKMEQSMINIKEEANTHCHKKNPLLDNGQTQIDKWNSPFLIYRGYI